eukprot:m.1002999 g.1002999  ORF g.1002999 m.1002999 type:complete len:882 (+) comp24039_c0_seq11:180-2825(+)
MRSHRFGSSGHHYGHMQPKQHPAFQGNDNRLNDQLLLPHDNRPLGHHGDSRMRNLSYLGHQNDGGPHGYSHHNQQQQRPSMLSRHWRGGSADDQSDGSDDEMHSAQPPPRQLSSNVLKPSNTPPVHSPSPSIYAQHRLAAPPQFPPVSHQYSHQAPQPPPPQHVPQLPPRRERGICYDFQRGACTRGSSCRFSHEDGSDRRAAGPGTLIVPGPPPGPPPPLGLTGGGLGRFQRDAPTAPHVPVPTSGTAKRARSAGGAPHSDNDGSAAERSRDHSKPAGSTAATIADGSDVQDSGGRKRARTTVQPPDASASTRMAADDTHATARGASEPRQQQNEGKRTSPKRVGVDGGSGQSTPHSPSNTHTMTDSKPPSPPSAVQTDARASDGTRDTGKPAPPADEANTGDADDEEEASKPEAAGNGDDSADKPPSLPPRKKAPEETKEFWLTRMSKCDNEITATKHELTMVSDRRKIIQFELDQEKRKSALAADDGTSASTDEALDVGDDGGTRHETSVELIRRIHQENGATRARILAEHDVHDKQLSPSVEPMFADPTSYAAVRAVIANSKKFYPRLMQQVKYWKDSDTAHMAKLAQTYKTKHRRWVEKLKKTTRRQVKVDAEARRRALFVRTFPELVRFEELRLWRAGVVNGRSGGTGGGATSEGGGVGAADAGFNLAASTQRLSEEDALEQAKRESLIGTTQQNLPTSHDDIAADKLFHPAALPTQTIGYARSLTARLDDRNGLVEDSERLQNELQHLNVWTEQEKKVFIERFLVYPKKFKKIADALPHKSTAECIKFYYMSKKQVKYKEKRLEKRRMGAERVRLQALEAKRKRKQYAEFMREAGNGSTSGSPTPRPDGTGDTPSRVVSPTEQPPPQVDSTGTL